MEPTFNTSFIPKKSLQEGVSGDGPDVYTKRRSVYGPTFFISALIFAISLLAAVGIFVSTYVREKQIDEKINNLAAKRDELDENRVNNLERMDKRLAIARGLVDGHVASTELLLELEQMTMQRVQYHSLSFAPDARQGNGLVGLDIEGVAEELEDVALQFDKYRAHEHTKNVTVSDLEKAFQSEFVSFNARLSLTDAMMPFSAALERPTVTPELPFDDTSGISDEETTSVASSTPVSEDITQ